MAEELKSKGSNQDGFTVGDQGNFRLLILKHDVDNPAGTKLFYFFWNCRKTELYY